MPALPAGVAALAEDASVEIARFDAELGAEVAPFAAVLLVAALTLADRLDTDAVLAMHGALLSEVHPEIAGRWLEEQVWIGNDTFGPHGAAFIPPHHERVTALMADL
jgi:hypothetical protein